MGVAGIVETRSIKSTYLDGVVGLVCSEIGDFKIGSSS